MSWINPDRKSKKKGLSKIQVRVIEYTIETNGDLKTYRLITSLMNLTLFPALFWRNNIISDGRCENTIDELKTHLLGRKTPIRSLKPREVVQEIYGWLLGHYAIRSLMFQASQQANISPLRLGFTGTLKVIRRAIPNFQDLKDEQLPFFSHG
ncbi:transposase (fragment) [Hyella patelloides LEGE 07179]|uniref:Transposase n=1 Tax=Hyella patelloides LEGE 07179 TaxID=945734 RepID=A0A563VV26_9CYAN